MTAADVVVLVVLIVALVVTVVVLPVLRVVNERGSGPEGDIAGLGGRR